MFHSKRRERLAHRRSVNSTQPALITFKIHNVISHSIFVNFQNTIHIRMNSTKYLGYCSMDRYYDFWCTDV